MQHVTLPVGIGQIAEHAAQRRVAKVRVQVDEAGHEGGEPEIANLLHGVLVLELGRRPQVKNLVITHENGTVLDV